MPEQPPGTSRPLVTVIVISYNYGRFIGQAIDSVLAQSYPDIEVLVVDDGSTDDTLQVLAGYSDRVTVSAGPNGGQASVVNRGVRLARGEIVFLLDADDTLLPDVVDRVVAAFQAEPRCARVQFRLLECDETGRPTGGVVPPRNWPLLTGDLSGHVMTYRMFRSPPTSGNAWRTARLRALPPVPEVTFRQYVDRWYSELTALVGTVAALDEPGACYRLHGESHHVGVGKGYDYFATRIELTRELHAAGVQMAAGAGLTHYPTDVDVPLDASYLAWRVLAHRLGPDGRPDATTARLALQGARAAWRQPAQSRRTRAARSAWVVAAAAVPRRGGLLQRLVAGRYERGTH